MPSLATNKPTMATKPVKPIRAAKPAKHTLVLKPIGKAPWDSPEPEDDEPSGWQYGSDAVQHPPERTGRRSARFPGLNITATAEKLNVTKSHLAKVLSGVNRPSVSLAQKLAETLGTDLNVVVGLYRGKAESTPLPAKPKSKTKPKTKARTRHA